MATEDCLTRIKNLLTKTKRIISKISGRIYEIINKVIRVDVFEGSSSAPGSSGLPFSTGIEDVLSAASVEASYRCGRRVVCHRAWHLGEFIAEPLAHILKGRRTYGHPALPYIVDCGFRNAH
jgi:hypothetical protein